MSLIQGNSHKSSVSGFYPKTIEGSLRFNDDDGAYLSWTPTSQGNLKTWTFSAWVKRAQSTGNYQRIFACGDSTDNYSLVYHDTGNYLTSQIRISGTNYTVSTAALYRDHSAWYHIVVEVDCTNAIHKLYVNGQQITEFQSTPTNPPNSNTNVGNTVAHYLGKNSESNQHYFEGYMAEVFFIDGTAHNADAFGETKNGVWVPKSITSADFDFDNNNSFHLTFQDDAEVEAFNTVLYRGNSGTQSITGMGFQPDLVWIKNRTGTNDHQLVDAVRGNTKALRSNDVNNEDTFTNGILSFDSDGVTLGSNSRYNATGNNYVAWGWKAGGAPTVDNSAGAGNVPTAGSVKIDGVDSTSALAGTIPATRLSASTAYGFSVVSYTANNTNNSTIAHGLGAVPDFVLVTARNFPTATNWAVWHSSLASIQHYLRLNTNDGVVTTDNSNFGTVDPTSTVMNLGYAGSTNSGTYNYIMYCWTQKSGLSAFGTYSGNGSSTGPIIYTTDDGTAGGANGFKPAFIIHKKISDSGGTAKSSDWWLQDNTRTVANGNENTLFANGSFDEWTDADGGGFAVDFLDNGFQLKDSNTVFNTSGDIYIYAAFADTREAAFWLDQSGNDNDWQPVNLDHNDTVADSPTDNFATWNGVVAGNFTLSEGNLKSTVNTNRNGIVSSIGFDPQDTDGYKAEFTINTLGNMVIGLADETFKTDEGTVYATTQARAVVYGVDGTVYDDGSSQGTFSSFTAGDVVTMYVKSGSLYYAVNGTLANSGSPVVTGISDDKVFWLHALSGASSGTLTANFGQQPFVHTTSLDS